MSFFVLISLLQLCFTTSFKVNIPTVTKGTRLRTFLKPSKKQNPFINSKSSNCPLITPLKASSSDDLAKSVTGEELEIMLTDFEKPIVVDAYATWCGPCLLMAPEFEAAAKELEGRVNFVKLDTDKEPDMAGRLNIMGLPTLLFLDELPDGADGGGAKAVLKDRIEGALRKDSIVAICEHLFFDGPMPTKL